jgi:subtilase family serine protease
VRLRRGLASIAGAVALLGGTLLVATGPGATSLAGPRGEPGAGPGAVVDIHPSLFSRYVSKLEPLTESQCSVFFFLPCYSPAQLETAYDELPLFAQGITGAGRTIVIVDPFGSPTIQADLNTFDIAFGLPAPPSFQIIQPAGPVPPFDPSDANGDVDWAGETTLDVEWAHAAAPGANILLVETPMDETEGTNGFGAIVQAENYVLDNHLGDVISQSFSATEETFPTTQSLLDLRSAYIKAAQDGVTVLGATGDTGAANYTSDSANDLYTYPATGWPATDPLVTAVGGTELSVNNAGQRIASDQVWNDTENPAVQEDFFQNLGPNAIAGGGGVSSVFPRPSYQDGVSSVVGGQRGIPDISMSAACSGAVQVYQSFPQTFPGWYIVCGTSEATPLFAGIVALADQEAGHSLGLINPALYALGAANAPGLVDITQGNNTVSFTQEGATDTVQGYNAGAGYDLASGLGTVDAALFVPELVQAIESGSGGSAP